MQMWLLWAIVGIALIIAEMTTFTFYLLWLGVGALVAAMMTTVTDDWWIQLLAACVTALILTLWTRPLTRNMRHSAKGFYDPYEHIEGKTGIVQIAIEPDEIGQVRIGTEVWSAVANESIAVDEEIVVMRRSSTILHVQVTKETV